MELEKLESNVAWDELELAVGDLGAALSQESFEESSVEYGVC
jgi:hypothetical protein